MVRRVTGLLEIDAGLSLGALMGPGRGHKGHIFGRYLAAHLLVNYFNLQIEDAAKLLNRERSTVTKALKVFRFLEGFASWRTALEKIANLALEFVAYGEARAQASQHVPAPVGRDRRNDPLPQWVRERYALDIEAQAERSQADEARARRESDSIYLSHPVVKALTDDPDLKHLIGELVVSVTLSPLDDNKQTRGRPVLLVPPREKASGAISLRLLVQGDSPSEMKRTLEARTRIAAVLIKLGYRLTGVAESFASRDRQGWRYVPLHIAELR